ncbi:MAG: AmmeMemoRadiSam system protein A [Candidatus Humimicrobiaceae bacterium]
MEQFKLNNDQKKMLLQIAKETLMNIVYGRKPPEFDIDDHILNTKCGAFVTLHMNGSLRGCIGNITAETPLWKTVRKMAVEAALHDPRFPPVSPPELNEIDIEISVLSPLKKIENISEIEVGKHGILIKKGYQQGLLLPQVATEYNWNRTQFLENTCQKAGMDKNCYENGDCEIYIYSATVFGEKDLRLE